MSKSAIYAINTTSGSTIAVGSAYAPNQIVRRFGNNCQMAGNGITLSGAGYYDVSATVTAAASAAGTVTATIYQDGAAVTGASSSATVAAAGDIVTLPVDSLVRLGCNCNDSVITVVITGQSVTSTNLALKVEKE